MLLNRFFVEMRGGRKGIQSLSAKVNYVKALPSLHRFRPKKITEYVKEDIMNWVSWLEENDYSEANNFKVST